MSRNLTDLYHHGHTLAHTPVGMVLHHCTLQLSLATAWKPFPECQSFITLFTREAQHRSRNLPGKLPTPLASTGDNNCSKVNKNRLPCRHTRPLPLEADSYLGPHRECSDYVWTQESTSTWEIRGETGSQNKGELTCMHTLEHSFVYLSYKLVMLSNPTTPLLH